MEAAVLSEDGIGAEMFEMIDFLICFAWEEVVLLFEDFPDVNGIVTASNFFWSWESTGVFAALVDSLDILAELVKAGDIASSIRRRLERGNSSL